MIALTINGGAPFHVRPSRIIAVGAGYREEPNPNYNPADPSRADVAPTRQIEATIVSIEGVGSVPVDQSIEEVLSAVEGSVGVSII